MEHFDIAIIGAGPAGTCAALRLLSLGYRVALIEKAPFPRPQIGESLSPGIHNLLAYLQADQLLHHPQFLHGLSASVCWESQTPQHIAAQQRGPGVVVNRAVFDAGLLALAQRRGLEVFQPAKLEAVQKCADSGHWLLRLFQQHKKTIRAVFVLDARGRSGAAREHRLLCAPPLLAMWTEVSAGLFPCETRVEALPAGWIWASPLPGGQYRIMFFADAAALKNSSKEVFFYTQLAQSRFFGAAPVAGSEVFSCMVAAYCHTQPWSDNYLRLGEAAFALDPLSSTGVEKAMRFSMQAAIAVNSVLKGGDPVLARSFYEERLMESVAMHSLWTGNYYAKAWPGAEFLFWQQRAQCQLALQQAPNVFAAQLQAKLHALLQQPVQEPVAPSSYPLQQTLEQLWNKAIYLSPQISYKKVACISGDVLEEKSAILHPGFLRETAYLDEVELVHLLDMARSAATFGEMLNRWQRQLGWQKAARIAIGLWDKGVVEIRG